MNLCTEKNAQMQNTCKAGIRTQAAAVKTPDPNHYTTLDLVDAAVILIFNLISAACMFSDAHVSAKIFWQISREPENYVGKVLSVATSLSPVKIKIRVKIKTLRAKNHYDTC